MKIVSMRQAVYKLLKIPLRRYWPVGLILLAQLIPPYASRGYALFEWGSVNAWILAHPIKSPFPGIYPVFQATTLLLCAGILSSAGQRLARVFYSYIAAVLIISALLQNISSGGPYGLAVLTSNLLTFFILAGLWLQAVVKPDAPAQAGASPWRYAWLPLALVAFWRPVHPATLLPDFNPLYLLTSGSALSFCLSTPLFLAALIALYPNVPRTAFAATCITGVFIALGNLALEFVIYPDWWWIGVLHIPLLAISAWGVRLLL